MEIAVGVIFLALFAGAFFLLVLITGFYFWRRSKRKNAGQNRKFTSGSQPVDNDSLDDDESQSDFQEDVPAYSNQQNNSDSFQPSPVYAESPNENSKMETGSFDAAASASMSYKSSSEGGDYASSGSNYSASYESSSSYDSSSGSTDSSSSSSSSDSGSSSSSSD